MTHTNASFFTPVLMQWHATENHRSLPWKSEKDPYKIWLSEIILQQTRALQGLPYYNNFTQRYPTIIELAAAPEDEVFRVWQGLGYYSRCKNMLATARYIANELGGKFPDTHDGILLLKGIGAYTAAAIASFAFGLPHAVVDGNVNRVLARYFGIETPFDTTEGKRIFSSLAQQLLDARDSAAYNQAIMDLGATVCTPRQPGCTTCPLRDKCIAYARGLTALLPVKSKKIAVATRYFHYILLRRQDTLWIHRRGPKDIWENLHEPFLIEAELPLNSIAIRNHKLFQEAGISFTDMEYSGKSVQRLTHRIIQASFFTLQVVDTTGFCLPEGAWLPLAALKEIAFPKTVFTFLKKNLYF